MTEPTGPPEDGSRPSGAAAPTAAAPAAADSASASSPLLRRSAAANIAGRALSAMLWIAITPYLLSELGKERFGVWALIFMVTGYVGVLDFGMGGGVSRFIAVAAARRDRGAARQLILRSLLLSGALGVVWTLLFVGGRDLFLDFFHVTQQWRGEVRSALLVFGISLFTLSISQVLQWCLIGFQRLDLWNLYLLVGLVVNLAVLVVGLAAGQGLMATAIATLAGSIVVALLAWRSLSASLAHLEPHPTVAPTPWRELLGFSAWVQLSNAFSLGQMQVGRVLLGTLGQLVWVTHFELGFRVTYALWSLSWVIQNAAYPALVHAYELGGAEPMRQVYAWCCRWVFLMAAWTLGLIWVIAPALFHAWLGEAHPDVVLTARWMTVAFAFATLSGPTSPAARGTGAPWLEVLNFGIALVTNLLVGLWLIPRLGAAGAAMAMVVSFILSGAVVVLTLHARIGVSTGRWLAGLVAPRFLAALVPAAALGVLSSRWSIDSRADAFVQAGVLGVVYTAAFVLLVWPTGEPAALWTRGRGWLGRAFRRAP